MFVVPANAGTITTAPMQKALLQTTDKPRRMGPCVRRDDSERSKHAEPDQRSHPTTADVVIVGGGLAGLFCALKLAPRPVTVISAAPLGEGASTAWAQGGIAAAVAEGDSAEAHAADTVAVGAGLVDATIALGLAREAGARIHDLLRYGVPFDRDLEGRLAVSPGSRAFRAPHRACARRHGRQGDHRGVDRRPCARRPRSA